MSAADISCSLTDSNVAIYPIKFIYCHVRILSPLDRLKEDLFGNKKIFLLGFAQAQTTATAHTMLSITATSAPAYLLAKQSASFNTGKMKPISKLCAAVAILMSYDRTAVSFPCPSPIRSASSSGTVKNNKFSFTSTSTRSNPLTKGASRIGCKE